MSQYCRVEVPMLAVKSIREAEPGMELEEAAFNRQGRVIAEEGEVLTEERIEQFKNLDVRKIVTLATEVQWLPAEELDQLERDVTVLERKEFSEAQDEILESLRENDTVETIRKTALHLRRQARHAGDDEGVDYLDSVIEKTENLQEEIDTIRARLAEVDDEEAREELHNALEGKIRELDETMLDLSAPDSLVRETINKVQEKEQLRNDLNEFVMDNPHLFAEGPQEVEVADFESIESPEASWADSLTYFGNGNVLEGVNSLKDAAKENPNVDDSLLQELEDLRAKLENEVERRESLHAELSAFDLDSDDYDLLVDLLEGRVIAS